MRLNDAVFGIVLLALGLGLLGYVQTFPSMPGQSVGPGLFPGVIACGLAACGALLVASGWRQRAGPWVVRPPWMAEPRRLLNFLLVPAGLGFYIVASERLGFLICGTALLATLFLALRVRPRLVLPVALGAALTIQQVFHGLLRVPLPWGLLQPFAW